jgi:hypothetical protein
MRTTPSGESIPPPYSYITMEKRRERRSPPLLPLRRRNVSANPRFSLQEPAILTSVP